MVCRLAKACDMLDVELVRALLAKGADRHIAEAHGRIPIDVAGNAIRILLKDASRMNLQSARHDKSVQREAFPEIAEGATGATGSKTRAGTARYLA